MSASTPGRRRPTPDSHIDGCATHSRFLVHRTLAGDQNAFAGLVRRYRRAALARALAILGDPADADDIAQEAFREVLTRGRTRVLTVVRNFEPRMKMAMDSTELEVGAVLTDAQRSALAAYRRTIRRCPRRSASSRVRTAR